jgi:LPXTG-motif cell wall-anchored protein
MILAAIAAFFATAPRLYAGDATLPKTATDAEIRILFGIPLCLVSLFLLVIRRRHLVPAVRHGR